MLVVFTFEGGLEVEGVGTLFWWSKRKEINNGGKKVEWLQWLVVISYLSVECN